jgi:hypothetical protein
MKWYHVALIAVAATLLVMAVGARGKLPSIITGSTPKPAAA